MFSVGCQAVGFGTKKVSFFRFIPLTGHSSYGRQKQARFLPYTERPGIAVLGRFFTFWEKIIKDRLSADNSP